MSHLQKWAEAIERATDPEEILRAWCACIFDAPIGDPELEAAADSTPELAQAWAWGVLSLNKMPADRRREMLNNERTRYWLSRLATKFSPGNVVLIGDRVEVLLGPLAPIWMEWRALRQEIAGLTQ